MTQVFTSESDAKGLAVRYLHPDAVYPLLGHALTVAAAQALVALFTPLADPSRARIVHLLALSPDELCVRDIALVLGMSVSALSHQLHFLGQRGAIERRKSGRIVYYRLADEHLRTLVLDAAIRGAGDR